MLIGKMGENAGLVWNALQNGALSTKAIKKATKLKETELNQAYGWLAREGKIAFNEVEGELIINLI
ncbi:MAG: winged helix-turn-helix domain-containing protein [Paludibacteraceae bacterium]|nr:winged helix-turn-helix domain-containing protein [Paludibacteraceae bacterium]